jgi:GDP-4-dehydro-6-deoxy-D-mannose reductase
MKKILLIGGNGFVGKHLKNALIDSYEVISTGKELNINNLHDLEKFIGKIKPDAVVHLAAISSIIDSIDAPKKTFDVNFFGTLNVLLALKKNKFKGRFLFISSSQVYGSIDENELPISEASHLKPDNPYAVSKAAAELLCLQWIKTENFKIIIARPFNHIGPGQSENFSISSFGHQLAQIKLGIKKSFIEIGDISMFRDFTDVRDVVSAYKLLLENGKEGEIYNIASNSEKTIKSLLDRMIRISGLEVDLRINKSRLRANDQQKLIGNNSKLIEGLNWERKFFIDDTLEDILNFWIDKTKTK